MFIDKIMKERKEDIFKRIKIAGMNEIMETFDNLKQT